LQNLNIFLSIPIIIFITPHNILDGRFQTVTICNGLKTISQSIWEKLIFSQIYLQLTTICSQLNTVLKVWNKKKEALYEPLRMNISDCQRCASDWYVNLSWFL